MDVAIFGAGAAGLMTAITLHRTGHQCRIFERSRQSHTSGMGFILVPECIAGLQSCDVDVAGMPLRQYLFRHSDGRIVEEKLMPPGSLGIRRRDLIAALLHALPKPEALTFDAELKDLQFDETGWVRAACLNRGGQNIQVSADLYVASDGISSRGRHALFPRWATPLARVMEVVGLVACKKTVQWTADNFNKFHDPEGGLALGIVPVDSEHVVWFIQFDTRRYPPPQNSPDSRRDFVHRRVGQWADPIPQLLTHTDFTYTHLWQPVDTDLVPRFNQGNLVLVGDAAHPLLPFTSQGVAAAVADALTLANVLKEDSDVTAALSRYSSERQRQCGPYVTRGRELMRNFLNPQESSAELPIALAAAARAF